jgi:hypothetical protein
MGRKDLTFFFRFRQLSQPVLLGVPTIAGHYTKARGQTPIENGFVNLFYTIVEIISPLSSDHKESAKTGLADSSHNLLTRVTHTMAFSDPHPQQ